MFRHRTGSRRRGKRRLLLVLAVATANAGFFGVTAPPASASANVGYACGYYSNVSFFGGAYGSMGCGTQTSGSASANSASPSVTRPASGASQFAVDSSGARAQYFGIADIFSSPYDANDNLTNSGELRVTTQGTSTIQSTAKATAVGPSPFWTQTPTAAPPYGAPANTAYYDGSVGFVQSTCFATSPTNKGGTVTIKNGRVDVHIGPDGYPTETVVVPSPTPVNHRVNFWIENVGDQGYIVFNERIPNPDGSLTINGAHMYMQGPNAVGELIIAQVKCGHS